MFDKGKEDGSIQSGVLNPYLSPLMELYIVWKIEYI